MKPIILAVDDEPQVLSAVVRDLRGRFGADYQIVRARSGAEALEALTELDRRGSAVALMLVDQRMPEMEGTDLLLKAAELAPDAKRVLLTAYADTDDAIASINDVGLDHYLMKPWDPPEDGLYPVLEDLLGDWRANIPAPFDGLRVVGALWSSASHAVKDFLARNRVPYRWIDIDAEPAERARVERTLGGGGAAGGVNGELRNRLPILLFPEGDPLSAPTRAQVADRLGLHTSAESDFYDLIVVGAGPAGLSAAVTAVSDGLRTLHIEQEAPGGQAGTSSRIENYLGFPNGLSGGDLASRAVAQVQRLGAELLSPAAVDAVEVEHPYRRVRLAGGRDLSCYAVLCSSGMAVRELQAEGVKRLTGAGVYYGAALTEAANFSGEDVIVVGGGNSAGQGALFFARYARSVTVVVRRASLAETMSHYLVERIDAAGNIEVRGHTSVAAVYGDRQLSEVDLVTEGGEAERSAVAALFVFIGTKPRTLMLSGVAALDGDG